MTIFELLASDIEGVVVPSEFDQFGRFEGSWDVSAEFFEEDGSSEQVTGEWRFDRILGGTALQDVLVFPGIGRGTLDSGYRVGTSVRFFDTEAGVWKVVWISPRSGTMYKLSGAMEGDRIVLHGDPHDGEPTRWIFEDMADDSFTWRGLVSDNAEWRLIQLMRATRLD